MSGPLGCRGMTIPEDHELRVERVSCPWHRPSRWRNKGGRWLAITFDGHCRSRRGIGRTAWGSLSCRADTATRGFVRCRRVVVLVPSRADNEVELEKYEPSCIENRDTLGMLTIYPINNILTQPHESTTNSLCAFAIFVFHVLVRPAVISP